MLNLPADSAIFVAKTAFLEEIKLELGDYMQLSTNLFCANSKKRPCFVQDIWFDPQIVHIESIANAVKVLRQLGRYWYFHPIACIRRSHLIAEQLQNLPDLSRAFPISKELPNIGVFALLDKNTMLYSLKRLKSWPDGVCQFIEDKENPPNRAYLKLWEAFSYLHNQPQVGENVLDLGASPGGWSYVLQTLGANVTAVDKAPLDPKILKLPNIHFIQTSAFAYDPLKLEQNYDWVLSDVACYPDRAYDLILKWISSKRAKQLIFTIKLQGKTDLNILRRFQDIPNSQIMNLFYNKHEATFFYGFFFST